MIDYFSKRDPKALKYLPKLLPAASVEALQKRAPKAEDFLPMSELELGESLRKAVMPADKK